MAVLIANNAVGNLSTNITATQTTITLQAGQGARFPNPDASQWFPLTLVRPDGTSETIRCTARATDSLTVLRAQESTTGKTFSAGDKIELRLTAAAIEDIRSPAGTIIMWSGSIASIPTGWALCNGSNGTPDLRGKFIAGAGGAYNPGNTGGADTVTLATTQIPAHNHTATTATAGAHTHGGATGSDGGHTHTASTGTAGDHGHTASTAGAGTHNHSASTDSQGSHTHNLNFGKARDSGFVSGGTTKVGHSTPNEEVRDNQGGAVVSAGAHTHNVSVAWVADHSHAVTVNNAGSHTHTVSLSTQAAHTHTISSDGGHTHTVTVNNTGGGASHENRPPYYALAYIMKL